jgi:APA family basic amino acid/polyamine antiporter
LTYFGYTCFETSSTLTAEAINPLRDIPRAIIYTVIFCMILYAITATSMVGLGIVEASKNHDADTALAISFKLAGVSWMA